MKKILILSLILVVMGLTGCTSSNEEVLSDPVSKVGDKAVSTDRIKDKIKVPTEEAETEDTDTEAETTIGEVNSKKRHNYKRNKNRIKVSVTGLNVEDNQTVFIEL